MMQFGLPRMNCKEQGKKAETKQSYLMAQKLAPDLKEAAEALKRYRKKGNHGLNRKHSF